MPFRVPLWLYTVLIAVMVLNVYTVLGTVAVAPDYPALSIAFPPTVRLVYGAIWCAIFGAVLGGLLLKRRGSLRALVPALTVYGALNLGWNLLFARADYARGQIGWQLVATLAALIPLWWMAWRRGWLARTPISAPTSAPTLQTD